MPEKYRGSHYERDPDDPGYSQSGPDTYHNLIADIVRQLQQREDPVDDEENADFTPSEHPSESAGLTPTTGPLRPRIRIGTYHSYPQSLRPRN